MPHPPFFFGALEPNRFPSPTVVSVGAKRTFPQPSALLLCRTPIAGVNLNGDQGCSLGTTIIRHYYYTTLPEKTKSDQPTRGALPIDISRLSASKP